MVKALDISHLHSRAIYKLYKILIIQILIRAVMVLTVPCISSFFFIFLAFLAVPSTTGAQVQLLQQVRGIVLRILDGL